MGRIVLFIILVSVGIFAVVKFSGGSGSSDALIQLSDITPTPSGFHLNQQKDQFVQPSPEQQVPPSVAPTDSDSSVATVSAPPQTATQAAIMTSKGEIDLSLYRSDAPNTVANFVKKAKSGFYKNLTFHRVEDWVIQGGDPKGDGTGGGQMKTELNQKPFIIGSLGVARGGDINVSNDAQFFITKKESSWLNNQYTNFGIVTNGMDVVSKIAIGDKILDITIK